jgi:hypothetical protein
MPATEEKVNTTLREVIGDSFNSQTQKKSDDTSSSHTESGAKQKEIVAGIDVSDIPDNMTKSEFKDFLAKKGKLVDDGATAKFREIAEYKKERDAIISLGVSPQEASKIIREAIANRNNDTKGDVKKEIKREIQILEEEAPDQDTRKGVQRLGKVVHQEVENSPAYKELKERLDRAEQALGYVANKTVQSRVNSLNETLDKLSGDTFDKDFINKYRDNIIEEGKKYPDAPINKIIQVVTDPDDYREAILKTKTKEVSKENRIKEKLNANDSASSGVTGSERSIDVKKVSLKGLISQVMSQKK